MRENCKVIEIKGELAVLSVKRRSSCGKCHACCKSEHAGEHILEAINECNAKIGDTVSVELPSDKFATATTIAYGIPLIMFFLGTVIGSFLMPVIGFEEIKEIAAFFLGIIFVIISGLIIKKLEKIFKRTSFMPVAKDIVGKDFV